MEKWIDINKQHPEKGVYVLTCDASGVIAIRKTCIHKFAENKIGSNKVTHWMPLPEKPL